MRCGDKSRPTAAFRISFHRNRTWHAFRQFFRWLKYDIIMTRTARVCVIDAFMSDQRTARGSADWVCFVAEYPPCLSSPQGELNGIHIQMPEWVSLPQKASFPWAQCHPDTRGIRIPGSYTHTHGASIAPVTNKHVFLEPVWILFNTAHLSRHCFWDTRKETQSNIIPNSTLKHKLHLLNVLNTQWISKRLKAQRLRCDGSGRLMSCYCPVRVCKDSNATDNKAVSVISIALIGRCDPVLECGVCLGARRGRGVYGYSLWTDLSSAINLI